MSFIIIICGILLFFTTTAIIDSFSESKSKRSISKVCVTRQEYEKIVKEIRTKELNTDKFKKISSFMLEHDKREYLDIEQLLFELISNYDIKNQISEQKKEDKIQYRINGFNALQRLINSLSLEQLNLNPYLKMAKNILDASVEDCKCIVGKLRNQINFMDLNYNITQIAVNMDIPEKTLKLLPIRISEQIAMSCYFSDNEEVCCINLLDDENKHIYTDYNCYVSKIDKLATAIYYLQLSTLLSIYPENITSYYFNIFNNSQKHRFLSSFFVTKGTQSTIKDGTYEVTEEIKENISKVIGLPYEQLINMTVSEIDEYFQEKEDEKVSNKGRRLNFRLR